jgi:hypothetical protein
VPNLPGHHRGKPAGQGSRDRICEHQYIGAQETDRTHQVQRLVDSAVMIIAVIIPPLRSENLKKFVHHPPTLMFIVYTLNVTIPEQSQILFIHSNNTEESTVQQSCNGAVSGIKVAA